MAKGVDNVADTVPDKITGKMVTPDYQTWISHLKARFQQAQVKAAVKVNSTLLAFYWQLGQDITEKQQDATWGSGFLKQVSRDLMTAFPDVKGFSYENIRQIRRWYQFYQQNIDNRVTSCHPIEHPGFDVLFQVPWGQNLVIISKCKTIEEALFYVSHTIEFGWSRSILSLQIQSELYHREGKALNNFATRLPKVDSDLANQLLKDPYNFEFLTLTKDFKERELENGLVKHITEFLLELGAGFAYIGKQVEINVGNQDFYIDLLFYHTKLHCYVVVELKAVPFTPEMAGKLNFYLAAVDGEIKHENDAPTIGILLCSSKNKIVVEYALKNVNSPMGVSEYEITESLPENLQSSLPSVEAIEAELGEFNAL
ncbi:MAG: PDDEXK nuclease domain-containing protein [Candidatus Endonucleobacter bathymodioli]|uniref:PDDEXK nuclease domain-containing protein n=1 Tax=Candidatus Endonucleibacter bathymodioli TaxID=539814 RepID=A0AA90SYQ7_9GAMM|nr:PDDEXK nuclease domain-containing protein [Candidatus Endonucleobacter bathymodioli]